LLIMVFESECESVVPGLRVFMQYPCHPLRHPDRSGKVLPVMLLA
jgi:hypothetical protein